ncbi:MAG: RusA family crossover junction endodeoxyribonuclease [Chlorobiaceae bacterium]|nr:RusA family crossover junction endodeoxyribonuclease [Chlorobiaceae bacterium]
MKRAGEAKTRIRFSVPGNPKALKRHRSFIHNRTGRITQLDQSAGDKADFLAAALGNRPHEPFKGPVKLSVVAVFQRPKSHFGTGKNTDKMRDDAPLLHVKKPDADNVLKFIKDALNGVFWVDDCQVCVATITKAYGEFPQVDVTIEEL